jgi:spoIIIJ-associated protein
VKQVEKTGKTVDEAINLALDELQAAREDVDIEILMNPARVY